MAGTGGIAMETCLTTMAVADESGPYVGMKKGTIEGVSEQSLRIDKTEFGVIEKLEITDQYRRPIFLKHLEVGQEVYFRLNHKNQVDKVIVLIPS
jgi:hypothetical protein